MNKDIKYITENYIEAEELCRITNISSSKLDQLIRENLIPNFSYQIETKSTISSPLADSEVVLTTRKYFSKGVVRLIKENLNLDNADSFKQKIKSEFINTFEAHKDNSFAYENIIQENGNVDDEKLAEAFEIEWKHYLNGIYGICTLNATGEEIAKKEIAVKKLISFLEKNTGNQLSEDEKQELIQLNTQYNEVSNLFSPYQRKNSSRGKYLDEILRKNSLDNLVKNYS